MESIKESPEEAGRREGRRRKEAGREFYLQRFECGGNNDTQRRKPCYLHRYNVSK